MDERQAKKRRLDTVDGDFRHAEPIRTLQDLQNALYLRQNVSPEVKQGIRRFKDFLTSIPACENTAEQASKLKLLKEYCDGQSSPEKYAPSFPDLISTWSLAAEHKADSILSAVPAVLAQFLKTISSYLEFRDFGISLCRTLLQRDQLRLFERGLSAPTVKQHVISPCLRLLTEMVSFDGGAIAQDVFSKRDILFKRLDAFLSEMHRATIEEHNDPSRPTLRRIAQRLVLANLKFQDAGIRGELISQGKVLHSFLQGMEEDGPDIVHDILQAIDKRIISDDAVPRSTKARFLDPGNLASLRRLYGYEIPPNNDDHLPARESVHRFLLAVCTQPEKGLLVAQSGWYPAGMNPEVPSHGPSKAGTIELGIHSITYFDDYKESVPIKNGTLSTFVKTLKPEQDTLQADLLLKVFRAAPELVADYFSKRTKFVSAPKDEPEWRGQFAFLFSVIQLPVPAFCGWREKLPATPPPLSIVIESLLPRPFDRAMLTRCLNVNQELITISGARAITVALQKLEDTIRMFNTGSTSENLWSQASERLVELFMQRLPFVKDIATALQRVPKDSPQLRGAIAQCLAVYFKVVPQSAGTVKFDVTKLLMETVRSLHEDGLDEETRAVFVSQLPDILTIAGQLPNTRWWQAPTSSSLTPFTSLMKVCASCDIDRSVLEQCKKMLHSIMAAKGILQADIQSCNALLASLKTSKKWKPTHDVFAFIENCMNRIVQQPVKYVDMLEAGQRTVSDKKPLSLLCCCVAEQWSFVAKNPDKNAWKDIAKWIARLFSALEQIGENFRVMTEFQEKMTQGSDEKLGSILQRAFAKQRKKRSVVVPPGAQDEEASQVDVMQAADEQTSTQVNLDAVFGPPSTTPTSLEGLDRWDQTDLDSAVANGRVGRLLQCTASTEEEVRRQSFHTIQSLIRIVEISSYAFKEQLHLMLGEVIETIKAHSPDFSEPIPSIAAELAAQLVPILNDPTDKMYGKVNRFLLKGPKWDLDRIISYWVDKIILSEPEDDDGHYFEVNRLLSMLQNGLRVPDDLEVYRRAGVWERILGLYGSAQCTREARKKVLGVLWRAMGISEAKGMLVRRAGLLGWLEFMKGRLKEGDEERRILEALGKEMEGVEDTVEVKTWRVVLPALRVKGVDDAQTEQDHGRTAITA